MNLNDLPSPAGKRGHWEIMEKYDFPFPGIMRDKAPNSPTFQIRYRPFAEIEAIKVYSLVWEDET